MQLVSFVGAVMPIVYAAIAFISILVRAGASAGDTPVWGCPNPTQMGMAWAAAQTVVASTAELPGCAPASRRPCPSP